MKTVAVVTPHDARHGFSLAGIAQHVAEESEVREKVRRLLADAATGLIIIDERLMPGLDAETLREIDKTWPGVLVVLPTPSRVPAEVEDYAMRLIRRAIGYHVRIRI